MKGTGLKYMQAADINVVPRYLVEQMKDNEMPVDTFYTVGQMMINADMGVLGVFLDRQEQVKGFFFITINPFDGWIYLSGVSVDKEYYGRNMLNEVLGIIKKRIQKKLNLKGIQLHTTRPKAYSKFGFNQSKYVRMEN